MARLHNKVVDDTSVLQNYLLFCAQLDDGRFISYSPFSKFQPINSKTLSSLKLETFLGTLEPACLNGWHPCHSIMEFINVCWQENSTINLTPTNLFMTPRMYQVP